MNREEKAIALRSMMVSDGWREVLKPSIEEKIKQLEQSWINGKTDITDDMLRGRLWALHWVLGSEQRMMELARQIHEEKAMAEKTEVYTGERGPY